MKRMSQFKRFFIACLLACPLFTSAAIPLSVYQSLIVPLPVKYANQGYFWGLEGGLPIISDIEFKGAIFETDTVAPPDPAVTPFKGNVAYSLDTGFMGGITFGYRYTYVRFEAEGVGYVATIGDVKGLPTNRFVVKKTNEDDDFGRFFAIGLFGNIMLDLHIAGTGLFPILGIGLGPLYVDYNPDVNTIQGGDANLKNACFQFAFQLIAGFGCTFTDHIEADFAFKYVSTKVGDQTLKIPALAVPPTPPEVTFCLKRDGTISFSTFTIELRFS